jgi:hypothetical protein
MELEGRYLEEEEVKRKLKGEGEELGGSIRIGIACKIRPKARGAAALYSREFSWGKGTGKKWRAPLLRAISPYPRLSLAHHSC